jgi:hypothetical protein
MGHPVSGPLEDDLPPSTCNPGDDEPVIRSRVSGKGVVAEVDFMLCVVAFLLLACVIVPVAAVAVLALSGRKPSRREARGRELSLPPTNGVR